MKFRTEQINSDPANVRRRMHTAYERYVSGESNFPRLRFRDPVEAYPQKTQGIAAALFDAWEVIDADNEVFESTVTSLVSARIGLGREPQSGIGLVITKVGLSMGRLAMTIPGETPRIEIETMRLEVLNAKLEGITLNLADGVVVGFHDGKYYSSEEPNVYIQRLGNTQAVFVGDRDLPDLAPASY